MKINANEISALIKEQIKNYEKKSIVAMSELLLLSVMELL